MWIVEKDNLSVLFTGFCRAKTTLQNVTLYSVQRILISLISCDRYSNHPCRDGSWGQWLQAEPGPELEFLFCSAACKSPRLNSVLPAPLACAILWGRSGASMAEDPLWLSGISTSQVGVSLALDSVTCWSSPIRVLCCHPSTHRRLKLPCQDLVHYVPSLLPLQLFPESLLLLLLQLFFQPHVLWRWDHNQCLHTRKGSVTFLSREGSFLCLLLYSS